MDILSKKRLGLILTCLLFAIIITGCQKDSNFISHIKTVEVVTQNEDVYLVLGTDINQDQISQIEQNLKQENIKVKTKFKGDKVYFIFKDWEDNHKLLDKVGINVFVSENFKYYTLGKEDKTDKLEAIYKNLTGEILKFYESKNIDKKINYIALPSKKYGGVPYTLDDLNLIVDPWDSSSSNKILHVLLNIYNPAFESGFVQCLQREGNEIKKEENVNLNTKKHIENNNYEPLEKVIKYGVSNQEIRIDEMGSFVYYNIYKLDQAEKFGHFLSTLDPFDEVEFVKRKYEITMGLKFEAIVRQWKTWLKYIDSDSDIYVKWDMSR